jgi:octaprenyl-diphosphate synthase
VGAAVFNSEAGQAARRPKPAQDTNPPKRSALHARPRPIEARKGHPPEPGKASGLTPSRKAEPEGNRSPLIIRDMTSSVASPNIADIQRLAAPDMAAVDALIRASLHSDVVLINRISEHIIAAGGKRLRPMLAVLAARALGYGGKDHHQLAAVVEFIHTATLLHDDVVDQSDLRRGRKTANALFGNAPSVLVGDFLYSRAFQLMVALDNMTVQKVLADTTNAIAEGEVLQLLHVHNPDTDEAAYLNVIERKTAVLFAAATRLGALVAGADAATQDRMAEYGLQLGLAFQIADDVLDYAADSEALGKNLGDDLAEGKATLPLIHAMAHSDATVHNRLRAIVEAGDVEALPEVVAAIARHDSLEFARGHARAHAARAEAALASLPDNDWTRALAALARYAVERDR